MKKRLQPSQFKASPALERKLEKLLTSVMESQLLDLARDLADHPKTPLKIFEQLQLLIECALPDCLWGAIEWDATKRYATASWKQDAKRGTPRQRNQREIDLQAFMRLCADYRTAREAGARAKKRWLAQRSLLELFALKGIEEAEASAVPILIGLMMQKLQSVEVLANE